MTLYLHTKQTYIGTAAERGGTTPDAEAVSVRWWETDTDTLYVWTGTAWQSVGGGTGVDSTTRIDHTVSPYSMAATDVVLFCDTDGGAITANLPAGSEGAHHKVINCGSSGNDVTVEGDGAETVYGAANQTLADGEVIDIHYNATEGWW